MLFNSKGQQVNPKTLPTGRVARELALAPLREVQEPARDRSKFFHVQERARVIIDGVRQK